MILSSDELTIELYHLPGKSKGDGVTIGVWHSFHSSEASLRCGAAEAVYVTLPRLHMRSFLECCDQNVDSQLFHCCRDVPVALLQPSP